MNSLRSSVAVLATGPACLLTAGSLGAAGAQVVADSAGVEIVHVDPADSGRDSAEQCTVGGEPTLQIGPLASEEDAASRIDAVLQLPDGRIAVADGNAGKIKLFGETGERVHSVGLAARGPADVLGLAALGFRDRYLLVYDAMSSRTTALDASGDVVGTTDVAFGTRLHEKTGGWVANVRVPRGMPALGWLDSGVLALTEISRPDRNRLAVFGESVEQGEDAVDLVFVGWDGAEIARVEGLRGDEWTAHREAVIEEDGPRACDELRETIGSAVIKCGPKMTFTTSPLTLPYAKTFQAAAGRNLVVAGHTATDEFRFYDAGGRLVRILRRANPPRRVDGAAKDAWLREQTEGLDPPERRRRMEQLSAARFPDFRFPEFMPAFRSLALDARDRLWVEEFVGLDQSGGSRWTVYDGSGAPAAVVAMPPGFRPSGFGPAHVLGVRETETGATYLQQYEIAEACNAR